MNKYADHRHCERSEAIQTSENPGLLRHYAPRNDTAIACLFIKMLNVTAPVFMLILVLASMGLLACGVVTKVHTAYRLLKGSLL